MTIFKGFSKGSLAILTGLTSTSFASSIIGNSGNHVFDDQSLHELHIDFHDLDSVWQDTLVESHRRWMFESDSALRDHEYYPATLTFDNTTLDTIGVRFKGEYSFRGSLKPLKLDINEFVKGQKLDGLKKLNLQAAMEDDSQIREKMVYDMFKWVGLPAPRSSFTKVYINGNYHGLFTVVEQVDKTFLKSNFSNPNGNLYKAYYATLDSISGGSTWKGNGFNNGLEIKSNEENHDWSVMEKVYSFSSSQYSGKAYSDSLQNYVDFSNVLKHMAVETATTSYDNYANGSGANIYWLVDSTDNMLKSIPWDYNLSLQTIGDNQFMTQINSIAPDSSLKYGSTDQYNYNWLYNKKFTREGIFSSPELSEKYYNHICHLADYYFTSAHVDSLIDFWDNQIQTAALSTPVRDYTDSEYTASLLELKEYFKNRSTNLKQRLQNESHTCENFVQLSSISASNMEVAPGYEKLVSATLSPQNSTYNNLKYTITDESIAKVNALGVVEGLSEGQTQLTLYNPQSKVSKTIEITVSNDISSIKTTQLQYKQEGNILWVQNKPSSLTLVSSEGRSLKIFPNSHGLFKLPSRSKGHYFIKLSNNQVLTIR